MRRWIRLYSETLHDPKVQTLSAEMYRTWINLILLSSDNDGVVEVGYHSSWTLRLSEEELNERVKNLCDRGLFDIDENGVVHVHNWHERQYESDSSKERVKRHRKTAKPTSTVTVTPPDRYSNGDVTADVTPSRRYSNGEMAVTVTPPDTDTDTDTDKHMSIAEATDGGDFGHPAPGKHPSRFAEFWDIYPRKDSKAAAEKLYRSQATSPAKAESIIAALRHQLPGLKSRDPQYRPHARTWLSQRRWQDDAAEPEPTGEEYEFEYQKPFPFDKIPKGDRGPDFP